MPRNAELFPLYQNLFICAAANGELDKVWDLLEKSVKNVRMGSNMMTPIAKLRILVFQSHIRLLKTMGFHRWAAFG